MKKLFIRLYLLVMLGVVLILLIGVPTAIGNLEFRHYISPVASANHGFIMSELSSRPADQWSEYIDTITPEFGFAVALLPIEEIPTDEINQQKIWQGDMVADELDRSVTGKPEVDIFFNTWSTIQRVADSEYALVLGWEENQINVNQRTLQGLSYYIRQRLDELPYPQWPDELAAIEQQTQIPLQQVRLTDSTFTAYEIKKLSQGKLISYPDEDVTSLHFQPVASIPYLVQVGPLLLDYQENWTTVFIIITSSTIFAIVLLVFLWPLWRALQGLDNTAKAFGQGNLEVRLPTKKRSPITGIVTTFNEMANRIQHLIRSQKELTNAVSHELRTPISSLRFGMEALGSNHSNEKQGQYLQRMHRDLDRLDSLIEELLYYSRLDARRELQLVTVELDDWLPEQLEEVKYHYPDKDFGLFIETSAVLSDVDIKLMSRAVTNLLLNAARHAKLKVELHFAQQADEAHIFVDDDGPGIPLSQRELAFEPFERLDASRDRRTGGHGLGLAIVQRIMEQHEGTVVIEDAPDRGMSNAFILAYKKRGGVGVILITKNGLIQCYHPPYNCLQALTVFYFDLN